MGDLAQVIEERALSLSREERAQLASRLIESIDKNAGIDPKEVEARWLAEAKRRYEAYLSGKEAALPATDVFEELRGEDA